MYAASRSARSLPGRLLVWVAALSLGGSLGGCISGRVLEGWPGYPFLSFEAPAPLDSTFFAAQTALVDEGFEIDFTERASGLVNSRPREIDGLTMFLSLVVDTTTDGASRVWVAGYEPVRGGARRVSPRRDEAWAALRRVTSRVSERLGGSEPAEPETPGG